MRNKVISNVLEASAVLLAVGGLFVLFGLGWALLGAGVGVGLYAWRTS